MYMPSNEGPGMTAYRAPSLFQPHRARQALRDAHNGKIKPLIGVYFGISSVPVARFVAPMGFDVAWVDWEHSSCNVETMTSICHELQFMSEGRTIPFVRIPGHDHAAVGYVLDAGANIVVPQVGTVEQAKHIVNAAKYGFPGTRSAPPFRYIHGLTDTRIDPSISHFQNMNRQAAIMIQIETLEGINNLDAILTEVPEIDAVWLGTLDTRVSMNMDFNPMAADEGEDWLAALEKYAKVMTKHDKPQGGFAMGPPEIMGGMAARKSFVVVGGDVLALVGMSDALAQARDCLPALEQTQKPEIVNGQSKVKQIANGIKAEAAEPAVRE